MTKSPLLAKSARSGAPVIRFLLADFFGPGFQVLLYLRHELVGDGAVD
jgi:hypothetical protein